jgi:hypothetical protein
MSWCKNVPLTIFVGGFLLAALLSAQEPVPNAAPAPQTASQNAPQPAPPAAHAGKGKPEKKKKVKPPKTTPVSISRGVLTVDGWAGKAALNYDIADLKYIYISSPGIGTAVVSNVAFPGAKEQPAAFNETSLKIAVDNHVIELTSDKRLLGKKPLSAWVYLDTSYLYPSTFPTVGYGTVTHAPYAWPGSKPNVAAKGIATGAPPVPVNLRPAPVAQPCPTGRSPTQAVSCTPVPAKPTPVPDPKQN